MRIKLLILIISIVTISCNKINKGQDRKLEGNIFTCDEIGWTIEVPKDWEVINRRKVEKSAKDGIKMVEKATNEEFDISGLEQLINFKKDKFNVFNSSIEPAQFLSENEWKENIKLIKNLLFETLANEGMHIDTTSSQEKIDGLDFEVFHVTILGLNNELILNQKYYSRYINGYVFGMNINYNNDEDMRTQINAIKNSKIRIRK
nr:hypothetical protein [uncultured Draconibacterium sp.]